MISPAIEQNLFPSDEKHGFAIIRPKVDMLIVTQLFEFKKTLDILLKKGSFFIAVDLTNIAKIDSSNIGLLRNITSIISEKSGMFCLFGVNEEIKELLKITHMDSSLKVFEDEKEFDYNFSM